MSGQTFSISSSVKLPVTIAAGATYSVDISFKPSGATYYSGVLTAMDATAKPVAQISISGYGSSATTISSQAQLTINPASVSFGDVAVGSSSTEALTVTSTGTAPATIDWGYIDGAGFTASGPALPLTLNPGQSVTAHVKFTPGSAGAVSGQLKIRYNKTRYAIVNLSGTGTEDLTSQLTVSPTSVNFGDVTVGSSSSQSVTLSSSGTAPVTIHSATISGKEFSISGATFPVTLNPRQTVTLLVKFTASASGTVTGDLTITSNASTNATAAVSLSGTGTPAPSPQLTLSATAMSFNDVTVGSSATKSLTLSSTGTAPVIIDSDAISGTSFSVSGTSFPLTLNPRQAVTLDVHFAPKATGTPTGQLNIHSNSSTNANPTVSLSGKGTAAPSPQLSVKPASLPFGDVTIGTSSTQTVTLTSNGTASVTVNSVTVHGAEFAISGASFPLKLNPNKTVTLDVKFTPKATGEATGYLTIDSNSSTDSTATVNLSGTGTSATSPQLSVKPTSLPFGDVTVGTSSTQTVTLTSNGTASVTINSIKATGAGFSVSDETLPLTLNPGKTVTLQVQFAPTGTGAVTGDLAIDSNSSTNAIATVSLSGTGVAAATPHSVDLGWNPPTSSSDPVAGYKIYRSTGGGAFELLNSSVESGTTYVDSTVQNGTTYTYYVESVDGSGVESGPSNEVTVTIPST
jgi:hypothetical protein